MLYSMILLRSMPTFKEAQNSFHFSFFFRLLLFVVVCWNDEICERRFWFVACAAHVDASCVGSPPQKKKDFCSNELRVGFSTYYEQY